MHVDSSVDIPISFEPPDDGGRLPLIVRPQVPMATLAAFTDWLAHHRDRLRERLLVHGALLFRGCPMASVEDFGAVTRALSGDLLEYAERSSPRTQVGDKVYTSTDYPPNQRIFPHNEHSYALTYPLHLFFGCFQPAARGGETPLVDIRRVTHRLHPRTVERFRQRGWMWVRNFGGGMGLPWQTTFQTSDRAVVENYCGRAKIACEWLDGERLRTRQVRPAFATHPVIGETLWFNHLTFFHISTLEPILREVLLTQLGEANLPNNTYYGDGAAVEAEVMQELREAYEAERVIFEWQRGDVLQVDNMLTAHAREAYQPPRRVVVAMAAPVTRMDIP
jgi:alpha-ketoglutarate-dependent taurine dioxygenase